MNKKTVLITGTSSGVGRETAKLFAQKGWNVVAAQRNPQNENELINIPNLVLVKMDVTNAEEVAQGINQGIARFGCIDVLLNNAGAGMHGIFEGSSDTEIRKIFEVNLFGIINTIKAILPHFRANKKGIIINVSSMGGRIGLPFRGIYDSSKFAVEGLSEVLYYDLKPFNITIKIVEPGFISSQFHKSLLITRMDNVKIYKAQLDKLLNNETHKGKGSPAIKAAKVIYKAAVSKSQRLRYIAGNDAILAWILRKLLPFNLFSKLLNSLNV
jgi:NAD(P)-dependent dehydrogenase (short-subunit alcohol dehydrogenase family)